MALSFAQVRAPGLAKVYECDVRLDRVAWFINEGEILHFGGGGREAKLRASDRLRTLGYDGIVDVYSGKLRPTYAVLRAEAITIVRVHTPG